MARTERENLIYYNVKVIDSIKGDPIVGASVEFVVRGGKESAEDIGTVQTNEYGFAYFPYEYKDEIGYNNPDNYDPKDIEDEECLCTVRAEGYETVEGYGVDPSFDPLTNEKCEAYLNDEYVTIELTKLNDAYYCTIKVLESGTNAPKKGVTVKMSGEADIDGFTTRTTDNDGKCTFIYRESGTYNAEITLNGYDVDYQNSGEYRDKYIVVGTTTDPTDVRVVYISESKNKNWYYVIQVKDNAGKVVRGAKVRLYKDSSLLTPYYVDNVNKNQDEFLDEVFYIVREILSPIVEVDVSRLSLENRFIQDLGVSMKEISGVFDDKLKINLKDADELVLSELETIEDLVNYIKDHTTLSKLPKTIYKTNIDGLIDIDLGVKSSRPNKIYANGIYLPEGYSDWIRLYGPVDPTNSNTESGLTLTALSISGGTYFHNFQIIDAQTLRPIENLKVVYSDENGNVLTTKKTDEDGYVGYANKIYRVYISIEKDGYKELNATYPGSYSNDNFSGILLEQKRTIQVVDADGDPVEGIWVTVFTYDALGNIATPYFGNYLTYETGYIDPLPVKIYENAFGSDIYVGILSRRYQAYRKSLIKQIAGTITTSIILVLPVSLGDSEDVENEFETFNDVSANGIKNMISSGNKDLDDIYCGYTDKVTYNTNDFRINIIDPDSVNTYDIFTCSPIIMSSNSKCVIGSVTVDMKKDLNDIHLKTINRYSGYYNPIFKDILFYNDFVVEDDNMVECPYSNTAFDYDYEDDYGKFGIIDHMWFHKVNDDKDKKIIKIANPYYPLTGQYALDNRKYNIFETNWDVSHYTRQTSVDNSERCFNTASMKDGICMFGSKYLNVPNTIEICGVSLGDDYDGTWNDDWIANPDGCPGEVMFKEVNDNSVDFYFFFKKRILRHFRENLKEEFEKYIGENYSFGKPGVDDDIDEYVEKNVLKLYKLEKVRIFIRRTKKGQHNSKIENEYGKYLQYVPDSKTGELVELTKDNLGYFKSHGFVEINNVTLTKLTRDDFDRKLVYNLRNGTQEDFGFSLVLKKI